MIVVQDESIFKAYDASNKIWKLETGGGIRKKGERTGVMVSAFLTEDMGLYLSQNKNFLSSKNSERMRKNK